ncbi:hypothetical protein MBLNU459_g1568t1 [Dothideomycetes sp. NU459]
MDRIPVEAKEDGRQDAAEVLSVLSPYATSPVKRDTVAPNSTGTSGLRTLPLRTSQGSQGHERTSSSFQDTRKSKRFSLTFPIQASSLNVSRTPSPTRSNVSNATPTLPESAASPTGPSDSSFLSALAAQERRVLELKEELMKAEKELGRMKREWAVNEATKKRHDVRKVQKLQSLNASAPVKEGQEDDTNGSSAWMQQEMERRKALLNSSKTFNRTVFSGSRHARTLSLLTPATTSNIELIQEERRLPAHSPESLSRPHLPPRVPTDQDLATEVAETANPAIDLDLPQEVLLKTGRKIASDFKDGLWTFIEDLRQATVGDEGVNGTISRTQSVSQPTTSQTGPRKQPSRASLKPAAKAQPLKRSATTGSKRVPSRSPMRQTSENATYLDMGGSFWKENGLEEPRAAARTVVRKQSKKSVTPQKVSHAPKNSLDGWDTWDSPVQEQKAVRSNSDTSASEAQSTPSPDGTSPRTSVSSSRDATNAQPTSHDRVKRDSIPWPTLTKLSPSNLRRTASHLMADWERSLTPPIDDRAQQAEYIGRPSSASSNKELKAD